jgi:hypothetical protein
MLKEVFNIGNSGSPVEKNSTAEALSRLAV